MFVFNKTYIMDTCILTCACVYTCCGLKKYIFMYACMYASMTWESGHKWHQYVISACVCVYIYIYTIHTCMYTYIRVHVYIYNRPKRCSKGVCAWPSMSWTYTCIYTYAYIHMLQVKEVQQGCVRLAKHVMNMVLEAKTRLQEAGLGSDQAARSQVRVCVCMCVRIHIFRYICVCVLYIWTWCGKGKQECERLGWVQIKQQDLRYVCVWVCVGIYTHDAYACYSLCDWHHAHQLHVPSVEECFYRLYTHTYIYMGTRTYIYMGTHTYIYMGTHTYIYMGTQIGTLMHICLQVKCHHAHTTHIHTWTHTYMYRSTRSCNLL